MIQINSSSSGSGSNTKSVRLGTNYLDSKMKNSSNNSLASITAAKNTKKFVTKKSSPSLYHTSKSNIAADVTLFYDNDNDNDNDDAVRLPSSKTSRTSPTLQITEIPTIKNSDPKHDVKTIQSNKPQQQFDTNRNAFKYHNLQHKFSDGSYNNLYERLSYNSLHSQQCMKEIVLGRRIGFYRLKEQIGSGNFSQVRLGTHLLTQNKVAVKILDKIRMEHKVRRLLSREISSMECLHHPNIVRFYEMIETLSKIFIIMEYASEGELYTKILNDGKLPETEAKMLYAQILSALQHMHSKNIIHRDMKAENIFFSNRYTIKIGDFGFSNSCKPEELLSTFCGSPPYAAPELFNESNYYGIYVDIWAIGVLLFFMVVGHLPFKADTIGRLKKRINACDMDIPDHVSDTCQFLIRSILRIEPTDRLTLEEIKLTEWMDGCLYPKPLDVANNLETFPRQEEQASEEHIETRRRLKDLGISEDHISYALTKQGRSSVAGTYKIILHQIQRTKYENLNQITVPNNQSNNNNNKNDNDVSVDDSNSSTFKNKTAYLKNKQSRLCAVL